MFQYKAVIERIVDGDTLKVLIDLGFYMHHETTIRLARINAPEVLNWGAEGIVDPARAFIEKNCGVGSIVVLDVKKTEKFGRWLAEVLYRQGAVNHNQILENPRVLNDELVREGLAKPYHGGKR